MNNEVRFNVNLITNQNTDQYRHHQGYILLSTHPTSSNNPLNPNLSYRSHPTQRLAPTHLMSLDNPTLSNSSYPDYQSRGVASTYPLPSSLVRTPGVSTSDPSNLNSSDQHYQRQDVVSTFPSSSAYGDAQYAYGSVSWITKLRENG